MLGYLWTFWTAESYLASLLLSQLTKHFISDIISILQTRLLLRSAPHLCFLEEEMAFPGADCLWVVRFHITLNTPHFQSCASCLLQCLPEFPGIVLNTDQRAAVPGHCSREDMVPALDPELRDKGLPGIWSLEIAQSIFLQLGICKRKPQTSRGHHFRPNWRLCPGSQRDHVALAPVCGLTFYEGFRIEIKKKMFLLWASIWRKMILGE